MAVAASLGISLPAVAQDVNSENEAQQIEHIQVTSRKRVETQVEVPMNVANALPVRTVIGDIKHGLRTLPTKYHPNASACLNQSVLKPTSVTIIGSQSTGRSCDNLCSFNFFA